VFVSRHRPPTTRHLVPRHAPPATRHPVLPSSFRVGRRDQPDFAVEDTDQVIEVFRAAGVARCFQQLGVRAHVALDVGARFRQQGFENGTGGLLMQAMLRIRLCTERVFQERHADSCGAADFFQRPGRPRFALHHLGEQGQPHTDNLAIFRESRDGLAQKSFLVVGHVAVQFRQLAERLPEGGQHFAGVVEIE
jgi:hypothetical protein